MTESHTHSTPHTPDPVMTLRTPSPAACAGAIQELGNMPTMDADWQPLLAPGSRMAPAPDARQVWMALDGWAKLAVPSTYEDLEGGGHFTNTLNGWRTLPLPEGPGRLERTTGMSLPDQWSPERHYHHAWYVLRADLGTGDAESFWLRLDAVAHACVAFVNGNEAGRHVGGYTPFTFEITSWIQPGPNTIALWVQDDTAVKDPTRRAAISQLDGGRGVIHAHMAGIRGGVYLEARRAAHVARIRVRPSTREHVLKTETWVHGASSGGTLRHAVYAWPNGTAPVLESAARSIEAVDTTTPALVEEHIPWHDPALWSPAHPALYVLRTTVTTGDGSETFETRFGFREFWIEGSQFILNGKPIRLFGDGSHPRELASLVPDTSREYNRRVLEFLKREFHFIVTRLHGQLFPVWAPLAADEAGCLVIDQSGLRFGGRTYYERGLDEFLPNIEAQYEEWYWRDVNSPSVVIWDMENELIRGQRTPELERWVLKLDTFIKKLDPDAIVEHSGAGWYRPDQQVIHVHMQEQYNRILRTWNRTPAAPLLLGEFWMGGRGETRLPNGYEYSTREDWHREEARLYREQMLEMRYYGASGIMPHRLTHWPLVTKGSLLSREELDKLDEPIVQWRFPSIKNYGARGLAPVVGFAWPRGATVIDGEPFGREVVVCNDREEEAALRVTCAYAEHREEWEATLAPCEQRRWDVRFPPSGTMQDLVVTVYDTEGRVVEGDRIAIHVIPRAAAEASATARRLVVVPEIDSATAEALEELNVPCTVSDALPADAEATIVLVPPGARDDALGRNAAATRKYLAGGGRLLALAQHDAPRWLPAGLPFGSAARSSVPEFDQSGWEATNKDLIYSREVEPYAPSHPAFAHLAACDFKEWHPVDGRISDDVFIRPNAVNLTAGAAYRVLLGATRRENGSLVECRIGRGTALFCQAQVLAARAHPAARTVFFNLLRYLDGPAWSAGCATVGLTGDLTPARLAALTGREADAFVAVKTAAAAPDLVLAGDHADADLLVRLAQRGCTVLVLSCETADRLPGYGVERHPGVYYSGTRHEVQDHPIFWGIAGASFLPLDDTPVHGALASTPKEARILLAGHGGGHSPLGNDWSVDIGFYGLETREPCPPIAVAQPLDRGTLIVTTIEPWNERLDSHRQLLANLLANAGVPIPADTGRPAGVEVKRTIPLQLDGKLDDWTNDMEDINLSRYVHADPIALTSKDVVEGHVDGDLDLSGLVYFLYDDEHLYAGGIAFSSGQAARIEIDLAGKRLHIDPAAEAVHLEAEPAADLAFATGQQPAGDIIDTRRLNLSMMHRQTGKPVVLSDTPGRTFEVAIPWAALALTAAPETMEAVVRLVRADGCVLQQPVPDAGETAPLVLTLHEGAGIVAGGAHPGG